MKKNDSHIMFCLPTELRGELFELCALSGNKASAVIRQLIQSWVDENKERIIKAKMGELEKKLGK